MDDASILLGLIAGGVSGWALARSMKINGRPWWWRHLASWSLAPFFAIGVSMVIGGLTGVTSEDGEPLGASGVIGGVLGGLPMGIALWVSWRAARRRSMTAAQPGPEPVHEPVSEPDPAPEPVPEPVPDSTPEQVPKPIPELTSPPEKRSTRLRFVYEDAHGKQTQRDLTNWDDDGVYVEGYCHTAGAVRTFRRDRIADILEGESLLGPMAEVIDEEPMFAGGPAMEILFTGFSSDAREDLEDDAEDAGLTVRKTVTKNLMFVCAGPKAGPSKLSKARAQGCTILSEQEYQDMLATGEVPG